MPLTATKALIRPIFPLLTIERNLLRCKWLGSNSKPAKKNQPTENIFSHTYLRRHPVFAQIVLDLPTF